METCSPKIWASSALFKTITQRKQPPKGPKFAQSGRPVLEEKSSLRTLWQFLGPSCAEKLIFGLKLALRDFFWGIFLPFYGWRCLIVVTLSAKVSDPPKQSDYSSATTAKRLQFSNYIWATTVQQQKQQRLQFSKYSGKTTVQRLCLNSNYSRKTIVQKLCQRDYSSATTAEQLQFSNSSSRRDYSSATTSE
jgi:hypothetical protein